MCAGEISNEALEAYKRSAAYNNTADEHGKRHKRKPKVRKADARRDAADIQDKTDQGANKENGA